MRFVSDIDMISNKFAIEWDDSYGRHWESYDTEAERDQALQANQTYQDEHQEEMEVELLDSELESLHLNLIMHEDGYPFDTPYWEILVNDYKEKIIKRVDITYPMLQEMKKKAYEQVVLSLEQNGK